MSLDLDQRAIEILQSNDRGGFTVPTARLYPYQWNWDSAFVALGFATFDMDRAWRELELLAEGQWADGMMAHILFRRDDPDYFPGPSVWQTPDKNNGGALMPTSGVTQPPVFASVVKSLLEQSNDIDRAGRLFDSLMRWHRWYHSSRTPDGEIVAATVHPWESGRDNCPDWELGLAGMEADPNIAPYERKDTLHSDPSERPSKEQYDKYVSIIKFGCDHDWDQKTLTNDGPFQMADPGLHFILLRANRDLLAIAHRLGRVDAVAEIESWIDKGLRGTDSFWNPKIKAFCARNMRTGEFSDGFTNASALCFYADAGTPEQRAGTLENMRRIGEKVRFMLPSWDPDHALFEAQRYWCGPMWPQMNILISQGLQEQGEVPMAQRLRNDLRSCIEQSGFYECFNPITGAGCIGVNFSWTAAVWLAWASPNTKAVAA